MSERESLTSYNQDTGKHAQPHPKKKKKKIAADWVKEAQKLSENSNGVIRLLSKH